VYVVRSRVKAAAQTSSAAAADSDDREAILGYRVHFDATLTGMVPGTSGILAELGQAGIRLIALTNWSAETFPVATERFGICAASRPSSSLAPKGC
jgi:phosphoglycolate phosphatase-like HAD superfamily hydrolase